MLSRIFFFLIVLALQAEAQETWPSPEVEQMYRQARTDVKMKNLPSAITVYRQVIALAPGKPFLLRELAEAQYDNADFTGAIETLKPLLKGKNADSTCYRLAAGCYISLGEQKRAIETLQKGIARYPESAMLYDALGNDYHSLKKNKQALTSWYKGLSVNAGYAGTYASLCGWGLSQNDPDGIIEGLLCGEVYLDLQHDAAPEDSTKKALLEGWKNLLNLLPAPLNNTFTGEVLGEFDSLTPVVSDGVTTETLTMVRTRFLMNWFRIQKDARSFCLFKYMDELLRNGKFEIYNEWLFGKAENITEFDAWNRFHDGDISRFLDWRQNHPLVIQPPDIILLTGAAHEDLR